MSLFSWLGKKKKKEKIEAAPDSSAPVEESPIAETPAENTEPLPTNTDVPTANETPAVATTAKKKPSNNLRHPSTAPNPVKKPSSPKTSAKPQAAKKPVEHESKKVASPAQKPFYLAADDNLKIAFEKAISEAEEQIRNNGSKTSGKIEFQLEVDGYHFYIIANNGQVLFDSPAFTTLSGALTGLATFKKSVLEDEFEIKADKYGRYRFILANKYYGENYSSKDQCLRCVESVKKFANHSRIISYTPSKEDLAVFESAKINRRKPEEVNWGLIEQIESTTPRMGKFEICKEDGKTCFYLLANNGQILYSSRYYANEAACRKGIESFKRATYVGNFFVDCDKFGHFRYVLKNIGSAPSFIGESYDNKPQCEKVIESVKNFVVSASIEVESTENQ